jgi:hypothetical protein
MRKTKYRRRPNAETLPRATARAFKTSLTLSSVELTVDILLDVEVSSLL